jgi:hypothetical protein
MVSWIVVSAWGVHPLRRPAPKALRASRATSRRAAPVLGTIGLAAVMCGFGCAEGSDGDPRRQPPVLADPSTDSAPGDIPIVPHPDADRADADAAISTEPRDASDATPSDTGDTGDAGDAGDTDDASDASDDGDAQSDGGDPPDADPDLDGDDDGTTAPEDCDDDNPSVHPGAPETCNGIDDDCNGVTDDVPDAPIFYRDADADGYGNPAASMRACAPPAGYVANAGDCDDTNGLVRPGVTDVCNGVNDDCSGGADPPGTCPAGCGGGSYGGHRYLFCAIADEWDDVADDCVSMGMRLTRVNSDEENSFIRSTASGYGLGRLWLGGDDDDDEGSWVWRDGAPFGYVAWASGEPNDSGGEDCLEMLGGGRWNDLDCGDDRAFVCEAW